MIKLSTTSKGQAMDSKKFDPEKIIKSLPEGFTGVSVPKGTRTVFIGAEGDKISFEDAKKATKKLAKELGLSIVSTKEYGSAFEFCLEDKEFNKQMRAEARAALKAVTSFYSKYGDAYRYDDETCESVAKIMRKVNNEED
jgi:hypothetical protein